MITTDNAVTKQCCIKTNTDITDHHRPPHNITKFQVSEGLYVEMLFLESCACVMRDLF